MLRMNSSREAVVPPAAKERRNREKLRRRKRKKRAHRDGSDGVLTWKGKVQAEAESGGDWRSLRGLSNSR